ncbi:hypothetical protein chiPu_0031085 [Chiloscyllium punctatum]|uniref:Uncharacterized protein n=1 Tax=Chiloscyllium punctatum TaxID=137246 RepID=A0A401TWS2_CHIPU|nr:hypothetical protein [Chiloscyllium punctatum]
MPTRATRREVLQTSPTSGDSGPSFRPLPPQSWVVASVGLARRGLSSRHPLHTGPWFTPSAGGYTRPLNFRR